MRAEKRVSIQKTQEFVAPAKAGPGGGAKPLGPGLRRGDGAMGGAQSI